MANRFSNPLPQYIDSAGNVYSGGKLYFYVTGTSTPTPTYSDSALTPESANPNPLVLNSAGRIPDDVFLDPNVVYKIVLTDANDVTIWTADPVSDPAANVTAAFRIYAGDPNGAVAGSAGSVGGSSASVIFDIVNRTIWVCTTTGTATTAVWTQMGATLTGAVSMASIVSPPSLAADQNDYSPASFSTAAHLRQDSSANVSITGLAAGTAGRLLLWTNISSARTQTFKNESSASAAANRFALRGDVTVEPGQSIWLWYDTTSSRWRVVDAGGANMLCDPGGRLTIASGEPVISTDTTGIGRVWYTPYKHNYAKLYNGAGWYPVQFSQVNQLLTDNTKSPAAAILNAVYDMFLWNDAGTIRCTRGPAWSTDTSRGTGAGTTELERIDGLWVNKVDITNGPTARRGLYVGTITTDASVQLNVMLYPAAASGGSANRVDIWNMFNRVAVTSVCRNSKGTWTSDDTAYDEADNSTSFRVTFAMGLNEESIQAEYVAYGRHGSANTLLYAGIGLNSVSAFTGLPGAVVSHSSARATQIVARYSGLPGIGRRYVQALEAVETGTGTFAGDNGGTLVQAGLQATWLY